MQERNVTTGGVLYKLPPHSMYWLQNPIEQEGTYPLLKHNWTGFMFPDNTGLPSFAKK